MTVSRGRGSKRRDAAIGDASGDPNLETARLTKLEALKRDVTAGVRSIDAGRVSRATPEDIKLRVLRRRAMR